MKYNLLGNTGLLVSEICFGTMTFGGKGFFSVVGDLGQKDADNLVKQSIDAGVNFIDTANVYSEGLSEEITGQAIHNLGLDRDSVVLATKARGTMGTGPNQKGLSRKHLMHQLDESLRRLKTDYIDLYQIHSADPLTPIEETLRALDDMVRTGKVRYIGASNVAAWQLMKGLDYSYYNQKERFASLQAYYTIAGRDLEREIIPLLQDQKVGLMVWSPLAGGLLSGKYQRDLQENGEGRRANYDFPPVNKEKAFDIIDALKPMAEKKGATVAQLSIAWLLHQKAVTTVIVGAKNESQLADNLKAPEVKFSSEELKELDQISQLSPEYPGWMLNRTGSDRQI